MLARFTAYLVKLFDFSTSIEELDDRRPFAQVPTRNIWRSVFAMFVLRLGSLNALEQELRRPGRLARFVGKRRPSADTIGYCLKRFDVDSVRAMLSKANRRAWRCKAIHFRNGENQRVVSIDGHESWSSEHRCCEKCLQRDVEIQGPEGKRTVVQYYHRVVVAQWVGVTPPGIIDLELIEPGEGEVVAARRLVQRILKAHPRLIDVIVADAIYLEAPFFKLVMDAGMHLIVTMRQEARDLFQDASQLRRSVRPQVFTQGRTKCQLWDLPGLTTFTTLGRPVRVVWAVEVGERTERRGNKKIEVTDEKTWIWVTDMPPEKTSARRIWRWGHDRWDIENRCFNELSTLWGMDHCYVHEPTAIIVLLLTLAMAFLLTYLFYERNLKPECRAGMTRTAMAARVREDLALPGDGSFWDSDAPGG